MLKEKAMKVVEEPVPAWDFGIHLDNGCVFNGGKVMAPEIAEALLVLVQ